MCVADPVNVRRGGCVESVVTCLIQRFFERLFAIRKGSWPFDRRYAAARRDPLILFPPCRVAATSSSLIRHSSRMRPLYA